MDASMLANAVSQRAAWALVPRPLNYGLSDAVSTHVTPRNGSVSISGTDGMFVAYGTLSRSFVLRHRAQMLANAVSRRAAWVLLVLQPMNYRLSDTVSTHVMPRNDGASVSGAAGRTMHRKYLAGALCCGIVPRCWQMPCRRGQRGC